MRFPLGLVLGVLVSGSLTCSDVRLIRPTEEEPGPTFDNKLKLSGRVCTSDPSDLVFPLKVLFVIDTSQSMNVNDPVSTTEIDPLKQTGRCKAIRDVIAQFIDIQAQFIPTYCNTGVAGCEKGSTACADCGAAGAFMCIGPDCCKAAPCKGIQACPLPGTPNGTCTPLCDVTKAGCLPTEKNCPDCPTQGDQCMGGICGKHRDPGVEFAIMRFGSAKQVLTINKNGVEGFTNDVKELVTSLAQVNNGGSVTDYEGALSMAFQTLSRDMADMQKNNTSAMVRSKYVVVFLSDGQPDPKVNDENDWDSIPKDLQSDLIGSSGDTGVITEYNIDTRILRRVKEIMGLKAIYRVGDIKVHTAYLAGDNPSWLQDQATHLLKQMSQIGKGTFRNFQNGEEINFLHVDFSSLRRVYRLKNFIVSNETAHPLGNVVVPDSDGDGLHDNLEHDVGTDPVRADTESDGFSDTVEHFFRTSGWDPLDPSDADCAIAGNDADGDGMADDSDGDGLLDCEERFLGTSKDLIDTDADGIPDGVEIRFGTNPAAVDIEDDLDFDGMPNGDEIRLHTNPRADDAAHRSRSSYRYNVKQIGTGIETVGRACDKDEECPSQADCREGFCRCVNDDGCQSLAPCTKDADCTADGEACDSGSCKGRWACRPPLESMKLTTAELVCSANKNISCYQFEVENITLLTPKAAPNSEPGWNQVNLYFGEVPFDNPMDYGNFKMACVRAWYRSDTGAKLPATGKLEIPETAWSAPRDFSQTYLATLTDPNGAGMECGSSGAGKLYCNQGDPCANPGVGRCLEAACLCPDGIVGSCLAPAASP